jgi:hypothetical protein
MKSSRILAGALSISLAQAAHAAIIVQHSGNTNPGAEGFTNDVGGPVFGSPVTSPPAWNMNGPWSSNYNQFALSPSQEAGLISGNWTLTAIMQNLSTGTGNQSGIYADIIIGDQRYDIDLQSDGNGDQVLSTNPFGSPVQTYTIPGLGTDYATFKMVYDASTRTVDYFVDGTLTISDWSGFSEGFIPIVFFGGVDGNFQLVSLSTGGVPEPSTWALLALGFAGLGFAGHRKAKGRALAAGA